MLSYSFVVWLEWRDGCQVRRRDPRAGVLPPRPDRRRHSVPHAHRVVADWLLQAGRRTPMRPLPPLRSYPLQL